MEVERGSLRRMRGLPDDAAARHGLLQDWAVAQQQRLGLLRARVPIAGQKLAWRPIRSMRWERLRAALSGGPPPGGGNPQSLRELGCHIRWVGFAKAVGSRSADRVERAGAERAQVWNERPGELTRDRHRGAHVRDPGLARRSHGRLLLPPPFSVGVRRLRASCEASLSRSTATRRRVRLIYVHAPGARGAFADSRHREISAPQGATKQASRYRYPQAAIFESR